MGGRRMKEGKLRSIQLLRALAALTVALAHLTFGFANHVGAGLGIDAARPLTDHLSQVAVATFFLVSGFVMVVSSRRLFGEVGASRQFWTRRATRILPPYWIATLLLVAVFPLAGLSTSWAEVLRSLALIPVWTPGQPHPLPLLWPGWTLFFELVFYVLFGLGVSHGRKRAVELSAGAIALLVAAGLVWQPQSAFLFMVTRPVLLLFVWGCLLGTFHESGGRIGRWFCLAMAVLAVVLLARLDGSFAVSQLGVEYLASAGLPALALFLAVVGGDWLHHSTGWWVRWIDLGGEVSFALYLLHVPVAHAWTALYPGRLYLLGPWPFLIGLALATLVASVLFWRFVEVPLTRWLNARLARS